MWSRLLNGPVLSVVQAEMMEPDLTSGVVHLIMRSEMNAYTGFSLSGTHVCFNVIYYASSTV